jgi:hypothetical protein
MILVRCKFSDNFINFAHAASQLSVEVVLNEVVCAELRILIPCEFVRNYCPTIT